MVCEKEKKRALLLLSGFLEEYGCRVRGSATPNEPISLSGTNTAKDLAAAGRGGQGEGRGARGAGELPQDKEKNNSNSNFRQNGACV